MAMQRSLTAEPFSLLDRETESFLALDFLEAYQEHIYLLHLPRGGLKAFKTITISSLQADVDWPQAISHRVHRYMHFNDLYQVSNTEGKQFSDLLHLFIIASGLPRTSQIHSIVAIKCGAFVNSTAEKWKQDGVLLVDENQTWKKAPHFQRVWDSEVAKLKTTIVSPERTPSERDLDENLRMSRRSSISSTRGLSDDNLPGKRILEPSNHPSSRTSKRLRRSSSRSDGKQEPPKDPNSEASLETEATDVNSLERNRFKRHSRGNSLRYNNSAFSSPGLYSEKEATEAFQTAEKALQLVERRTSTDIPSRHESQATDAESLQTTNGSYPTPRSNATSISGEAGEASKSETFSRDGNASLVSTSPYTSTIPIENSRRTSQSGTTSREPSRQVSPTSQPSPSLSFRGLLNDKQPHLQRTPLPTKREQPPPDPMDHSSTSNTYAPHSVATSPTTEFQPQLSNPQESPASNIQQSSSSTNAAGMERHSSPGEANTTLADSTSTSRYLHHSVILNPEPSNSIPDPSSEARDRNFVSNTQPASMITTSDSRPPTTVSSDFSISTPAIFQQTQASHASPPRTGKRRGRRPNIPAEEQQYIAEAVFQAMPSSSGMSESHRKGEFQNSGIRYRESPPMQSGPVLANRTLPPPVGIEDPRNVYRPPEVIFTIDNRAESTLVGTDIQNLIDQFTKSAKVQLPSSMEQKAATLSHPIGTIMWQTLPDFYRWYNGILGVTRPTEMGPLQFEMIDINFQHEKTLVVSSGNAQQFRMLKQYIWDLFWVSSNYNSVLTLFRVLITPFKGSEGKTGEVGTIGWNAINQKFQNLPTRTSSAAMENIAIAATAPLGTKSPTPGRSTAFPSTHASPALGMLPSPRIPDASMLPNRNLTTLPPIQPSSSSRGMPAHQHSTSSPPKRTYTPPDPSVRTPWEKTMLYDRAQALILTRPHLQLLPSESSIHDKLPYKTGSEVMGCIIDRKSPRGRVMITGKGYLTQNIPTGPDEHDGNGGRYQEVSIQAKQTCMLHGGAVVLYYKKQENEAGMGKGIEGAKGSGVGTRTGATAASNGGMPEILVRLQISGAGHYSAPFPKSVLRPKLTTIDFFSWFAEQTGYNPSTHSQQPPPPQNHPRNSPYHPNQSPDPVSSGSGGRNLGPEVLRFTFKDAMPRAEKTEVVRGNEDHFTYMRRDIKGLVERSMRFCPGMGEFVVLVSVPGWGGDGGENAGEEEAEDEW